MNKIIVIFGSVPGGCHRTEELKRLHGCTIIINGWDGQSKLEPGTLAITTVKPPYSQKVKASIPAAAAKRSLMRGRRHG